jgi:hypothetical protein
LEKSGISPSKLANIWGTELASWLCDRSMGSAKGDRIAFKKKGFFG